MYQYLYCWSNWVSNWCFFVRCLRSHLAFLYSSIFFINSIFLAALPIPLPASSVWVRYGREIICRTLSAACSRNLAFRFICRVIFLTLRCLPIHCSPGVLRLLNRIKFSNINMMLIPQLKILRYKHRDSESRAPYYHRKSWNWLVSTLAVPGTARCWYIDNISKIPLHYT